MSAAADPHAVAIEDDDARATCEAFAKKLGVLFDDAGECGFGRPCVGFRHGDQWVAYNPLVMEFAPGALNPKYMPLREVEDARLQADPNETPNAYHKSDCLAVLVHGGNVEAAVLELAAWASRLDALGVELHHYATGARGVHAIFKGATEVCVRVLPAEQPSA